MSDPARFWDKFALKYSKKPVKDMENYDKTLDRARNHLSGSDEVLEVGCGTGTTALILAPSVKEIIASDISSRMIEIAKEKAVHQQVENVRFDHATLFDENLEEGSFDVVMAFNFLHLLEDIPVGVRRVNDLLKPGGRFISKTICLREQGRRWGILLPIMKRLGFAPYVKCLKVAELEEIITSAGFEIVERGLYPPSPPCRFIVARRS
ncbi:MAG: methyltransferase domain-containing protein [Deltaproteobacteria bacterium]|nr:methyltransferase domain-containing protein [Deltaproteobacteria bacterium]